MTGVPVAVDADYFDGRSARSRRVRLDARGGRLVLTGDGFSREVALSDVRWEEVSRAGNRHAELPDGATLQSQDAAGWDRLRQAAGVRDDMAVRASRSWRATLIATVALVVVASGTWIYGVPAAANAVVKLVPASVEQKIGDEAIGSMVGEMLAPSRLPRETRDRITDAFREAVAKSYPQGGAPAWRLDFYRSRIGPNAFALPGGRMVMTDELVELAQGAGKDGDAMLVGVLSHELGHVRGRHGMRGAAQAGFASLVAGLVFGDVSSLVAAAPALLLQQGYSRDFEREADRESVRMLKAAGYSPAVMADFFERMQRRDTEAASRARQRNGQEATAAKEAQAADGAQAKGDAKGDAKGAEAARRDDAASPIARRLQIALSSHPADAERIRFFREAATRP